MVKTMRLLIICVIASMALAGCESEGAATTPTTATNALPSASMTPHAEATSVPSLAPTAMLSAIEPTKISVPEVIPLPEQPPVLPSIEGLPEGAVARLGDGLYDTIVLSPHGRYVAVSEAPGIRLLDANTFQQVWFSLTNRSPSNVAFSPDGGHLAATVQGELVVWDVVTGVVAHTFEVDTESLISLAWSPDSTQIAGGVSNWRDGEYASDVLVWEIPTGQLMHVLRHDLGDISALDWSPSTGWLVAKREGGGNPVIWDVASEQQLIQVESAASVNSLTFSPDGKTLAIGHGFFGIDVGGPEDSASLYDAATGQLTFVLEAPGLYDVTWSPSGRMIAASQVEGNTALTIWDASTGKMLRVVNQHDEEEDWLSGLTDVAWSPIKGQIASAQRDGTVYIWDVATGSEVLSLTNAGQQVEWLPSGDKLVTRSATEVILWDITTAQTVHTVRGSDMVLDVAWSQDKALVATSVGPPSGTLRDLKKPFNRTAAVRLWNVNSSLPVATLWADDIQGAFWTLAFSPDGSRLAAGSANGQIAMWDVATQDRIYTLSEQEDAILDIEWSPAGQVYATASLDEVILWASETGERLQSWGGVGNTVAWSPDGRVLSTAVRVINGEGKSAQIALQVVETGERTVYAVAGDWVNTMAWSPDGKRLAVGSGAQIPWGDNLITVLDAASGEVLAIMAGHNQPVTELVWSPDGTRIMASSGAAKREYGAHGYTAGGFDGSVAVWDAATGKLLRVLAGHTAEVQGVALSPDGMYLASGSLDGTVIVWDVSQ